MKWRGYTLIELLFSIALFSSLLGILFSVFGAINRAQNFHDANSHLTQAATLAFEPMVRALKSANAVEQVNFTSDLPKQDESLKRSGCLSVRGFYLETALEDDKDAVLSPDTNDKLVTITAEPTFNEQGSSYRWVRREFVVTVNPDTKNRQLIENDYDAIKAWPEPLSSCKPPTAWNTDINKVRTQTLTPPDVQVDSLSIRMVSPVVPTSVNANLAVGSPFAQVVLMVSLLKPPKHQIVPPVTLQTTVVPTFTYGEQRE